jgi:hypothetical protein
VDKRRRKRGLTTTVKTAIDLIVFDRISRLEACKRAGITERGLYFALEKPEVAIYFNRSLEVLRSGERPRNIHRLGELRDQDANRAAAVQAIRALEGMGDDAQGRPGSITQVLPGLTVVIRAGLGVQPPAPRPPIDITPPREIEHRRTADPIFTPNGSKSR